jgi:transcriptional regulator with XRE-family HTH domain
VANETENGSAGSEPKGNWGVFGAYLRTQRNLAQLSLRQLAELTRVSNPYLSQIERGLHQPSVAVIKSLARALNLSVEDLLAQAAGVEEDAAPPSTESAIRRDPRLSVGQKSALLAVYHSMLEEAGTAGAGPAASAPGAGGVEDGQVRPRGSTRRPAAGGSPPSRASGGSRSRAAGA